MAGDQVVEELKADAALGLYPVRSPLCLGLTDEANRGQLGEANAVGDPTMLDVIRSAP
jgi:hypothetical protein